MRTLMTIVDWLSRRRGRHEVGLTRLVEWVEVRKWGNREPGWIPRYVLEGMAIDCSPLDRHEMWMGKEQQGTVWFTQSQATKIRNHPAWNITEHTDDH